ncbi:hypothetical protein ACGFIE_00605 [Micromonospora sp. NPDC049275]|uniref:hypothetical protein n=1 Tax=Micromonospora sp. NPDC049275 TaxID=3364268 RepID=UPI0037147E12
MPHLWNIDHPHFAVTGHEEEFNSFDELRQAIDDLDEGMNVVYRWDWKDWSKDAFFADEGEHLFIYLMMPGKEKFASFVCPISKDQEDAVATWLRGPRVLGALRQLWEPLLDTTTP